MKLNQDVEDTRTYRGQILDRYSYLSQFRSGISDWSARMDFDFTPAPEHHIKFGAEYIHHTFRPASPLPRLRKWKTGSNRKKQFMPPAIIMYYEDKRYHSMLKIIST